MTTMDTPVRLREARKGVLVEAPAGRTTLSGEGLRHQDGASHLIASTIRNCASHDPCNGLASILAT